MANPVGWFEIFVGEMERAKTFYEKVFLKTLESANMPGVDMWMFPMDHSLSGAGGALVKMPGMEPGGKSTMIYFSCEDCAVEEKRVAENGGNVMKPKFAIGPYGFIALINDTEGNMIGLHSQK